MTMHDDNARLALSSPVQAVQACREVVAVMARLEAVLTQETALLKENRLQEALACGPEKTEASRAYVDALGLIRSNAVALRRWAGEELGPLKAAQERLSDAMTLNMTVLATTRSVAEGILRSLARQVAAPRTLTTYGAGGRATGTARPPPTPLAVSRSL